jgi:glycosyltransferase involved in cell wall biosynthesis
LKILLVHPRIFAGGAEKAIVYLAYHLNQSGHKVVVCTLSADLEELPPIARQVRYVVPEMPVQPSKLESTTEAVRSVIAETTTLLGLTQGIWEDFEVLSPCNFPAYWSTYPYRNSKHIIWISSEVFGPYNVARDLYSRSRFFRKALKATVSLDKYIVKKSVDMIITCSELNRRLIRERYGLDARVIPTAVDYNFFNGADGEAETSCKENYVLLHVGAFVRRKNQILSIRALHRLKRVIPDVKLILVGEGPWESALRDEAERLGLTGDVIFAGFVPEERLRALYNTCDVNIFPVEDQTYGLVPFEALAAGKFSLVSENSGAGQLMKSLGIGYAITPDVEAIVNGVLDLWKHPDSFEESVALGRTYVRENLTWERYAAEMADVYQAICNS